MKPAAFELTTPTTLADALEALAEGATPIAGGTDLLPGLAQGRARPERVLSLHRLDELRHERVDADGTLELGALRSLADLSTSAFVQAHAPMLAQAASLGASPQLRAMGTLGGNLSLDTRCRFVNQTAFWRGSLGGCLKSEGSVCHVVPSGRRCVAALSADLVAPLVALDATIVLASVRGARELPLADYYRADGTRHLTREPDELLVHVRVPPRIGKRREAYVKWRPRGGIDFPLVSIALRFDLDEDDRVADARVVAAVLGPKPRELAHLDRLRGRRVDAAFARDVAELVHAQCKPLPNVPWDPEHRRELHRVLVRRAIEGWALESGTASGTASENEAGNESGNEGSA